MTPQHPTHWWSEIADPDKPIWEILPHEAGPGEVIVSKRNELGALSNLALTPFELDGLAYASVEALWQECKLPENASDSRAALPWPCDRAKMRTLHGLEAKRLGDQASALMKTHGIDWVSHGGEKFPYPESGRGPFYRLIRQAMEEKLRRHAGIRELLLATAPLRLQPDHVLYGPQSEAHRYCEIWMEIRANPPE